MPNASVAIALQGPMQSYSTSTHERQKSTSNAPTKSAVLGLVAACLGRLRAQRMDDLHALRCHVRIDQPGHIFSDFQTSTGGVRANGEILSTPNLLRREYIASGAFLVILNGDRDLIEQISAALHNPTFQPYLGTRTCLPGRPLHVAPVSDAPPEELLASLPLLAGPPGPRDALLEDRAGPTVVYDSSPDAPGALTRRYLRRRIRRTVVHPPEGAPLMAPPAPEQPDPNVIPASRPPRSGVLPEGPA